MKVETAAVIGGGTMGSGIAHVLAIAGLPTTLVESSQVLADKAIARISENMGRQAAKGAITPEAKEAALARLKATTRLEDAGLADIVIEAVPEDLGIKTQLYSKLDAIAKKDAILASNTSSIPIAKLAAATKRPGKVIGMHFMNPVPVMKLVELIRCPATSEDTYQAVHALTLRLGKTPACSNDFPGFIANRILMPMINEAVWALHEGVAAKEDIDLVMKLGMNHPMGPLTLADFIGLDVCLAIMKVLREGFKDDKYRPCPLLETMVAEGRLGKKNGKGFYDYGG